MRKFIIIAGVALAINILVLALPKDTFEEIGSLPAHPLIVHSVVILLPLVSLFIVIAIFWKKIFVQTHLYLIAVLASVVLTTQMAKSSGYSLTKVSGFPKEHIEWGNNLVLTSALLLLTLIAFSFLLFIEKKELL